MLKTKSFLKLFNKCDVDNKNFKKILKIYKDKNYNERKKIFIFLVDDFLNNDITIKKYKKILFVQEYINITENDKKTIFKLLYEKEDVNERIKNFINSN